MFEILKCRLKNEKCSKTQKKLLQKSNYFFTTNSFTFNNNNFIYSIYLLLLLTLIISNNIYLVGVNGVRSDIDQTSSPSVKQFDDKETYENEISSEPEIECGYGVVNFRLFTKKGNAAQVYVRGQSNNPECVFKNTKNVTIELSKCNVRRKREVNPSGVAYQMTVIVQLHPLFVTKLDRAYNVNCFYMERREQVNVEFGVSEITTRMVQNEALIPVCTYSVHRDSPNGPLVKFTRVGEQLYHVWECPSKMYSMLLHGCSAVDGNGKEYNIIDDNGCSKDEFLMPQVTYTAENTKAMAASAAFNFPDRNTMMFTCKIKLCYHTECKSLTPPNCSGNRNQIDVAKSMLTGDLLKEDEAFSTLSTTLITASSEREEKVSESESTLFKQQNTVTVSQQTRVPFSRSSAVTSSVTEKIEESSSTTQTRNKEQQSSATNSVTEKIEESSSTTKARNQEQQSWESTEAIRKDTTSIPNDFPRPAILPNEEAATMVQDEGSGETIPEKITSSESTESTTSTTSIEQHETTAPIKILKRAQPPSASAAAAANQKNSAVSKQHQQPSRQQRQATTPLLLASKARAEALHKHMVDFDITSPELTIMDDYLEEPSASQRLARDLPLQQNYQNNHNFVTLHNNGICFSFTALISAASLLTILTIAVIFILLKARKSSLASFY